MANCGNSGLDYSFLLYLIFFLLISNSLCACDISPIRLLRRFPSSTHLDTSWRSSAGTWIERVTCPSFHVSNAASWIGPSRAHRHVRFPHLFRQMVREAWTKGLIFRIWAKIRLPASLVVGGLGMTDSIHTISHKSTTICH